jgi:hypothetical protein
MGSVIAELAERAGISLRDAGGLRLVMGMDTPAFLDACLTAHCRIVGIEGFDIVNDGVRPDMEAIADFSAVDDPAESVAEARRFVGALDDQDRAFDFVLSSDD